MNAGASPTREVRFSESDACCPGLGDELGASQSARRACDPQASCSSDAALLEGVMRMLASREWAARHGVVAESWLVMAAAEVSLLGMGDAEVAPPLSDAVSDADGRSRLTAACSCHLRQSGGTIYEPVSTDCQTSG